MSVLACNALFDLPDVALSSAGGVALRLTGPVQ